MPIIKLRKIIMMSMKMGIERFIDRAKGKLD